jgi:hypothetical protein
MRCLKIGLFEQLPNRRGLLRRCGENLQHAHSDRMRETFEEVRFDLV